MSVERSVVGKVGLLVVLCLGGAGGSVQAQEFGRIEETKTNVAYFYHAQPGQATVQVSVWGTIPRPGIYEVSNTTDLDKLLTMAGGLPLEAYRKGEERPEIMVRLYRPRKEDRALVFEASLQKMLRGAAQYPTLRDEDIVVVQTIQPRQRFGWRDVLSIASTLGTLTLLGLRIFARV